MSLVAFMEQCGETTEGLWRGARCLYPIENTRVVLDGYVGCRGFVRNDPWGVLRRFLKAEVIGKNIWPATAVETRLDQGLIYTNPIE